MRENLRLSVAKMDASFHFMRWSLVQECLATADFSNSAFTQLVLCSLGRNERFRPVSPIYTKPHSHGMRYSPGLKKLKYIQIVVLLALMKIRAYKSKALR